MKTSRPHHESVCSPFVIEATTQETLAVRERPLQGGGHHCGCGGDDQSDRQYDVHHNRRAHFPSLRTRRPTEIGHGVQTQGRLRHGHDPLLVQRTSQGCKGSRALPIGGIPRLAFQTFYLQTLEQRSVIYSGCPAAWC